MITLAVWLDQDLVGQLSHDAGSNRFAFEYSPDWLQNPRRFPLSPQLPLDAPEHQSAEQHSAVVRQFFENLLPEGEALDHAAQAAGTSKANLTGLLIAIGKETAGAVRVTVTSEDQGEPDKPQPELRLITPQELSQRLRKRQETPFSVWDGRVRLSIAGYQDKIAVYEKAGKWYLVEGPQLATTFIVKPLPVREGVKTLPENEYMCMQLARRVGLNVAATRLLHVPEPVLFVQRFDRREENGRVARLHVIDGCQALGLSVSMKYERNYGDGADVANIREGASLQKLFAFVRAHSPRPAVDVRALLRWTIFQVLVGNTDAHGKNVSFFSGLEGPSLAPAYDVVCIPALDAKLSHTYAMAIGDAFKSADLSPYEWAHFAHVSNLPFPLVAAEMNSLAQRVLDSIEEVANDVQGNGVPKEVAQRIADAVVPECTRHREFAPQVRRFKARGFN
jgi:serine/threonine-protein kinase HipA